MGAVYSGGVVRSPESLWDGFDLCVGCDWLTYVGSRDECPPVCVGEDDIRASVSLVVSLLSISLLAQPPTHNRRHGTTHATSLTADDCSLQFQGSARKAVK